jgi:hypothetical protein
MKNKTATKDLVFLQPDFWLRFLLAVIVSFPAGQIVYAQQIQQVQNARQNIDYFHLISTVEYTAKQDKEKRQYRHQMESCFAVTSWPTSARQKHYRVSTDQLKMKNDYVYKEYKDISQINYDLTDQRYMTAVDTDLQYLKKMNNQCIDTLKDKDIKGPNKTWTCRFNLGIFNHYSLPDELKFTVSSIKVPTKKLGDLVAVRAISDPFMVKVVGQVENYGYVKCQVASVYLFNPYVLDRNGEDLYVSTTAFVASTKMDDMTQEYRYEFGTYKTDVNGTPVDINGLDYVFEGFVKKIKLTPQPIEVNKPTGMPFWAKSEIVNAAQLASTCSAVACEQTIVNPVSSIYLAAARIYQLQDDHLLIPATIDRTVCQASRADVKAIYPMNICGRPLGGGALWIAAVVVPVVTYHHDHHDKSPSSP